MSDETACDVAAEVDPEWSLQGAVTPPFSVVAPPDAHLRAQALEAAIRTMGPGEAINGDDVMIRAARFLNFLLGSLCP